MVLLICGAGQYGIAAKEVAQAMGCFDEILFLDDNSPMASGKLADIETVEYDAAFVAIGNPELRERLYARITKPTTLIHPKAVMMPSATVAAGSIIEAGAVICTNAKIGFGSIVMSNAVVGHDASVGDYCQLKYGCVIPERCDVPDKTKIDCNVVFAE